MAFGRMIFSTSKNVLRTSNSEVAVQSLTFRDNDVTHQRHESENGVEEESIDSNEMMKSEEDDAKEDETSDGKYTHIMRRLSIGRGYLPSSSNDQKRRERSLDDEWSPLLLSRTPTQAEFLFPCRICAVNYASGYATALLWPDNHPTVQKHRGDFQSFIRSVLGRQENSVLTMPTPIHP
eukprot:GDKK01066226.1.p1 GENE.GDKK01066226.1~~GDKK01066226.1.p1  ORF type:complete len:187 (+),score=35.46 GDKK01066226.1:27-563(+)